MKKRFVRLVKSFGYAKNGLKYNMKTQPNFRIHITCAVLAIALAAVLKFTFTEWAILTVIIFLVFAMETLNTAIETTIDLITEEKNQKAMIAKDSAAAAVLLIALASVFVGILLYLRKIIFFILG